jgi:hypothetical protein
MCFWELCLEPQEKDNSYQFSGLLFGAFRILYLMLVAALLTTYQDTH